ncbi:MAG: VCBS repeat-containing protein [Bacteroidales bacterium]|nr:VCBS repeat-containing protein [Bacteroidales bacterium]
MKKQLILFILLLFSFSVFSQEIPFAAEPDWESAADGQIATGLGLADINGDGWKDLVVSNGNDIELQRVSVYYNIGDGSFPDYPDWESADIDYHGHLAVGDIDKDGWIDVAVSVYIGHGGFLDPGKVKVYYNTGGELESFPSFESASYHTFACALGDADGDGDLDLATTGGEIYNSIYDVGRLYINRNGRFNSEADWTSSPAFGSIDVDFADVDLNGYLDLVFTSEETPDYIFLADDSGVIGTNPSWQNAETDNFNNSLDFGFLGTSGYPAVVTTGNSQLGGEGEVRMYNFASGVPTSSVADWTSEAIGYGSGILVADINLDGINDLVYSGWSLPIFIALGDEAGFELTPSYTSETSSVVEAIQMADLNRDGVSEYPFQKIFETGSNSVVYLDHQLIENILWVSINGFPVSPAFYSFVPNKNYITFKDPLMPGDVLTVLYEYSEKPEIVITNWDSQKGNYIFYNQGSTQVTAPVSMVKGIIQNIRPNPAENIILVELYAPIKEQFEVSIRDVTGKVIFTKVYRNPKLTSSSIDISSFSDGTYFLEIKTAKHADRKKFVIL